MSKEAEFKFHLDGDTSDPKVHGVYKRITATGMEWRVVGPLAKAIHAMLAEAIHERDEARAELADLKRKITEDWVSVSGDMPGICAEWEQRGYRRGVQDAAKEAEITIFPSQPAVRAILALLEQTSDSNRPHPGNGAVPKSET